MKGSKIEYFATLVSLTNNQDPKNQVVLVIFTALTTVCPDEIATSDKAAAIC